MAYKKTIINQQTGKKETGTVLEIVEARQPIIHLTLEDGNLVKVKSSILEIMRLEQKNEKGEYQYRVDGDMRIEFSHNEEQENE